MKRLLYGLIIITVGVVLLLSGLGVASITEGLRHWWPALIIAIGAIQLIDRRKGDWWPIAIMVIGAMLLLRSLELVQFDFWSVVLPAIVITVGLSMVLGGRRNETFERHTTHDDLTAVLGGVESTNTADDYQGGKVTAVLGGASLNLRKASIKKEASISLNVIMGGVEITVAEDVIVKPRAAVILGGLEDKTRANESAKSPVLYLDGMVVMGGVEIKR